MLILFSRRHITRYNSPVAILAANSSEVIRMLRFALVGVWVGVLAFTSIAAEPMLEVVIRSDVTYATVDAEKLQLDLAVPKAGGPYPCVVCLHGGAWKGGSRKDLSRPVQWADFGTGSKSLIELTASQGYAAASVSYRLAPKNKFPSQIQDVKTAVRYLRANAKQLNIDPDRIGVVGFSAGGHLAALLGTTEKDAGFDGELFPDQSSRVSCVVDFFGPADLTLYCETPGIEKAFMVPLLGASSHDKIELYKNASPTQYVSKATPPFLILHGTADIVVPLLHSQRLHAKLREAGVQSELVTMRNKGHGWFGDDATRSHEMMMKFLNEHLKAK